MHIKRMILKYLFLISTLKQAELMCRNFRKFTGKELCKSSSPLGEDLLKELIVADFALVSHDTAEDPLFNFANRTALNLFEMSFSEFIALPSRKSAEPLHQEERSRLLSLVSSQGFIKDYCGIRISASGRRFYVEDAVVWNLIDESGEYKGQAAAFSKWRYVD